MDERAMIQDVPGSRYASRSNDLDGTQPFNGIVNKKGATAMRLR